LCWCVYLTFLIVHASGQTNVWDPKPAGDGISWSDPNNWSLGHIPTSLEDVIISETNPAQDSVVIDPLNVTAKSITLANNNKLLIRPGAQLSMNALTSKAIELTAGSLTNRGTVNIDTVSSAGI